MFPQVDFMFENYHFKTGLQVECYRASRYKIKRRDVSARLFLYAILCLFIVRTGRQFA